MEKYYAKYEQRYKAVYAAGADQWGYTPDDAILNAELETWVGTHSLCGKKYWNSVVVKVAQV